MDFANRGNRPIMQQQPAAPQMSNETPVAPQKKRKMSLDFTKLSSMLVLFGTTIVVAVLIVGLVFGSKGNKGNKEADLIKTDKYQAIFLSSQDGQVYFGKLGIYNSNTYVLTDIYYVRVEQKVQPEGTNQQAQQNISLAKLGNELHGPEDYMYISKDKVLFWENLKDDGQVAKAISDYKKNGDTTKTTDTTEKTDTTTETTQNP